jgi:hypothetical protein
MIAITIMMVSCSDDDDNPTGNGTTPLRLLSVGPYNGADSIAVDATVWATFSQALDSGSVTPEAFFVSDTGVVIAGEILVAGQTATFTPTDDLRRGATYTAHLTTAVTDINGRRLPEADSWSFSTVPKETIELIGSASTPSLAWSLYLENGYAYVADVDSGLQIFQIMDPTYPQFVAAFDSISDASGVAANGNYAYLCGNLFGSSLSNGLFVIDVSSQQQPTRVGTLEGLGWMPDIHFGDNYVFIADWDVGGLHVVSVNNPANPILAATLTVPGTPYGVYASGNYVYLTTERTEWAEWEGLHIIDVTNPISPSIVGSLPTTDRAMDVHVVGNYAYVAADSAGLRVIDISSPSQPTEVGHFAITDAAAFDIFVSGNFAYVADYTFGLQIIDISDPTQPVLVDTYDTPGACRDLFVQGSEIFVADYQAGLQVLSFSPQ